MCASLCLFHLVHSVNMLTEILLRRVFFLSFRFFFGGRHIDSIVYIYIILCVRFMRMPFSRRELGTHQHSQLSFQCISSWFFSKQRARGDSIHLNRVIMMNRNPYFKYSIHTYIHIYIESEVIHQHVCALAHIRSCVRVCERCLNPCLLLLL